jgi:hypothetical protein
MKKQRFQVSRGTSRRNRKEPGGRWVAEPLDVALMAAVLMIILWLHWLTAVSA